MAECYESGLFDIFLNEDMHVQEPQEPCVFSTPGLYSYIRSNKKTMENGH